MPPLSLVPDVLCLAACAVAVVTDVRSFRIPNWLTGSTFLIGLLANAVVAGVAGGGSAWWGDGLLPSALSVGRGHPAGPQVVDEFEDAIRARKPE